MIPDFNNAIPDECWNCKICEDCRYRILYLKEHPPTPVHPLTDDEKKAVANAWDDAIERGVGEAET